MKLLSRWQEERLTQAELKQASVRGGAFTFAGQLVKFILNMAVTIWLAHLLVPEDFGLVAMVMIIVNFFALFKDAGLSLATIQQENITHEQLSLLFWLNAVLGIVLAALFYLLAPAVALFYHDSRLLDMVQVLSLVFFLGGLSIQHESLMRRQMRFLGLMLIEVTGLVIAAIATFFLATQGYGYWAMVGMQVVAIAVRTLLLWFWVGWLPSLPALKVGVRKMARFGGEITLANVIQYLSRQSDQMLLGWWSGAYALGLYSTAMQMLMLPLHQILAPLTQVAVVTLSRLQDDHVAFRRIYLLLVKIVSYATMPLMAVLAVLSDPVVHVFLGEQWLVVVPIVMVLASAGWILAVNNTMGWVLIARGQGRRILRWNLMMAPVMTLAFVCALPWGAEGMAWAFFSVIYGSRYFHLRYVLAGTSISLADLYRHLLMPATLSFILAATAWVSYQFCIGVEDWICLLIVSCTVCVVAGMCILCISPLRKECLEIVSVLGSLRHKASV